MGTKSKLLLNNNPRKRTRHPSARQRAGLTDRGPLSTTEAAWCVGVLRNPDAYTRRERRDAARKLRRHVKYSPMPDLYRTPGLEGTRSLADEVERSNRQSRGLVRRVLDWFLSRAG